MAKPRTDYNALGARSLLDEGVLPGAMSGKTPEARAAAWRARANQRGQEIKESRDPRKETAAQTAMLETGRTRGEQVLEERGLKGKGGDWELAPEYAVSDALTYRDLIGEEQTFPGGRGSGVYAETREVRTPEEGMIRQVASGKGFGSTEFSPKQVEQMEEQKAARAEQARKFAAGLERSRNLANTNAIARLEPQLRELNLDRVPVTKSGKLDVAKAEGLISQAKRQGWESDKRAFAEGQKLQRESRRALTRVNRALRGAPDFDRYGRTAGYGETISADEWQDLLDRKAMLEANIAARETLGKKGITELGRNEIANRKLKAAQARELAKAEYNRALASGREEAGVRESIKTVDPVIAALNAFGEGGSSLFTSLNGGYGLPFVYPVGPTTK